MEASIPTIDSLHSVRPSSFSFFVKHSFFSFSIFFFVFKFSSQYVFSLVQLPSLLCPVKLGGDGTNLQETKQKRKKRKFVIFPKNKPKRFTNIVFKKNLLAVIFYRLVKMNLPFFVACTGRFFFSNMQCAFHFVSSCLIFSTSFVHSCEAIQMEIIFSRFFSFFKERLLYPYIRGGGIEVM